MASAGALSDFGPLWLNSNRALIRPAPRPLLGEVARLGHRGEQRRQRLPKVRPDRRVIEETRGGAGLQRRADVRLDRRDMALVPTVGRNCQIVGIEDRNLDPAIFDRRAPVCPRRIAVNRIAEVVEGLLKTASAALSSSTPSVTMNSTSCGLSPLWLVPLPGFGM